MNYGKDVSYEPGTWYNELYRIFADNSLLTVVQTIKLGNCLRSLQAGENALYHLNELLSSVSDNPDVYAALDDYIHAYIENQEKRNEKEAEDEKENIYG